MPANLIYSSCADLVFGAAILHHLVEPGKFIANALRVVKPRGSAFFFEPFEGGLAIFRLILDEVSREANRRGVLNRFRIPFLVTKRIADKLRPQIFGSAIPSWRDLDDKWAFPRSVLEEIARDNDADLQIYGRHDNVGQFKRHFFLPDERQSIYQTLINSHGSGTFFRSLRQRNILSRNAQRLGD
jgi:SAM-dependent methyltransferase